MPSGTWLDSLIWETSGETLRSAATGAGPDRSIAFCLHTQSRQSDGTAADRLRIGVGRITGVEIVDLIVPPANVTAACAHVTYRPDDGSTDWLVVLDNEVVVLSAPDNSELHADRLDTRVVTDGSDFETLGAISRRTSGSLTYDSHDHARVLLTLDHTLSLMFERTGGEWGLAWPGWEPSQYLAGAPAYLLVGIADLGAAPGFVTYVTRTNTDRKAGLYWQTGEPQATWDPPPFGFDSASSDARAVYGWTSPSGTAELLLVSEPSADPSEPLQLGHARRSSPGVWQQAVLLDPFYTLPRGDRSPQAHASYLPSGELQIFAQDTREDPTGSGAGLPPPLSTALYGLLESGAGWQVAEVARGVAAGRRFLNPVGVAVGCGHPAVYAIEQVVLDAGGEVLRMWYFESPRP